MHTLWGSSSYIGLLNFSSHFGNRCQWGRSLEGLREFGFIVMFIGIGVQVYKNNKHKLIEIKNTLSNNKRKIRYSILGILCVFFLVIGYAVYVNIADVPDSFFNPQPENITQFLSLEYPPISGYAVQGTVIHINIYLTTKGNFVQGQNVSMSVSGSVSDRFLNNLKNDYYSNTSYIFVALEGA